MPAFNIETCARPNVFALKPYRCARDDYKNDGTRILLDANENSYGPSLPKDTSNISLASNGDLDLNLGLEGLNRYPDPYQSEIALKLCRLRNTHTHTSQNLAHENLFVSVGSDEAIDALLRCFCVPGRDQVLVCPPTYGMYSVSAQVNDLSLVKVPLLSGPNFGLDVPALMDVLSKQAENCVKVAYFASPGNPTGSLIAKDDIRTLLEHPTWNGILVVDEAYIDFASDQKTASLAEWVLEHPNLVVMQTLSKAFGMAGIRLGATFAPAPIARLLNNLKAPYNISSPTSALGQYALSEEGLAIMRRNREKLLAQRDRLLVELPKINGVGRRIGGIESNFLLFEMLNREGRADNEVAMGVYEMLAEKKGVVVRFRGNEHGCLGGLRITVGMEEEVTLFLEALKAALEEVRTA